jgi:hypothetical protein
MARKSSMSLMSGVPVSAMSSGRERAQRIRSDSSSTCCERCATCFDEVRLVDDHPAEAEGAEPADVAVGTS